MKEGIINTIFYLSHKIRGSSGDGASNTEQAKNCCEAVDIGRRIVDALPSVELYIPGGQSEQFVSIAYKKGYVTEEQILDVDCTIIDGCEGVLVYVPKGDTLQGGRLTEHVHAIMTRKPVYIFEDVQQVIVYLTKYIMRV